MPEDRPIIIRGGSLYIDCKRSKLKDAVITPDGYEYEHDLKGRITSVEIKSGTGEMKFELNAPILDSKNCEITIHYEVASHRRKKAK